MFYEPGHNEISGYIPPTGGGIIYDPYSKNGKVFPECWRNMVRQAMMQYW